MSEAPKYMYSQDIRGTTLVLIRLHPELFCSHDLWHCACSPWERYGLLVQHFPP
jgi:hypothetical protein